MGRELYFEGKRVESGVGALSLLRSAAVHKVSSQSAKAGVCRPKYWRCAKPHTQIPLSPQYTFPSVLTIRND